MVFCAEVNEARLSGTRWKVGDDIFEQTTESGFKAYLNELLDNFIEYRAQCNKLPNKEGVVRFGGGLNIEWLPNVLTYLGVRRTILSLPGHPLTCSSLYVHVTVRQCTDMNCLF